MAKLKRFSGTPVSEGVRLEVGRYTVFAVRNADRDISVRLRREPRKLLFACMRIPFLRGVVRFLRGIVRFFDGLNESAELKPQRPVRGTAPERTLAGLLRVSPQSLATLGSAILIPIIAFLCLYAAPEGAELMLRQKFSLSRTALTFIACAVRAFGFLLAAGCVVRLRVLKRLAMYSGAIHKAFNCYECREELSAENAAAYPLHARRSDSAFMVLTLFVSLILFGLLPALDAPTGALARLAVLVLVAALLNEPFALLESAKLTLPVRVLRAPMDLIQHITTLEPHPQMLEVAVCAMRSALGESGKEVTPN